MKQIEFTLEAFGPDGMLKEGYEVMYRDGEKPDFVKKYEDNIVAVDSLGDAADYGPVGNYFVQGEHKKDLILYRRTRTAEEIAQEYYISPASTLFERFVKAIQAGMDEMK